MPVLLKIFLYAVSILTILYGCFGNKSGLIECYIPEGILNTILSVLYRICFIFSGGALFLLVNCYSELSDAQIWILIGIIFNPLIILCAISLGYMVVLLLIPIGIFIVGCHMFLWDEILQPIIENIEWLSDEIGLTPKLKNGLRWLYMIGYLKVNNEIQPSRILTTRSKSHTLALSASD